jgi:nicotinamide-nucleotide amidase
LKAEIISIGTELLLGEITDTNASFLAGQLPSMGIDLYWVSQVGDNPVRLKEILERAWKRSDLILMTGGLGPTVDDITRETIAALIGEKMEVDPDLEKVLRERFSRMNLYMPQNNMKQATLIPSAKAVPNDNGTAPGWFVEKDGKILVAMPGPPRELHAIWANEVKPRLVSRLDSVILSRTFKTYGLSEGAVDEMVTELLTASNPTCGIYAKQDGIYLRLAAKAKTLQEAGILLVEAETTIRKALGEHIWGVDDETIETIVSRLMVEKRLTLAVMEDCSGSLLTTALAEIPASRSFFSGGLFACTDKAKTSLGVNENIINRYGTASPEAALAMAEAARKLLNSDIGIGTSAVGPKEGRPMGVAYLGISDGNGITSEIGRPEWKNRTVSAALFELRKILLARK